MWLGSLRGYPSLGSKLLSYSIYATSLSQSTPTQRNHAKESGRKRRQRQSTCPRNPPGKSRMPRHVKRGHSAGGPSPLTIGRSLDLCHPSPRLFALDQALRSFGPHQDGLSLARLPARHKPALGLGQCAMLHLIPILYIDSINNRWLYKLTKNRLHFLHLMLTLNWSRRHDDVLYPELV